MASSGRYQSRLFNFVKARSRRLTEQYERAIRHLQVSVKWGVQVLLSPVHLLYQPHQSAKKLDQTVQQSWPQIQNSSVAEEFSRQLSPDDTNSQPQTLTADTPIQRILLLFDKPPLPYPTLKKTGTPVGNGLLAEPCTEEDILTLIAKSEPVNFLAFLAPWRFKLFPKSTFSPTHTSPNRHRSIIRGIATQLSNRTLVLVTDQNEILDSLTTQQQQKLQERIIEEVADYWRHQRLAYSKEQQFLQGTDSPLEHSPNTYQALAFLDRTVAETLESNYLSPVSEVAITFTQRSWGLVRRVQTQLIVLLSSEIQLGSKSSTANATDAHTLQIQALIWAAIDYFFGRRRGKQLGQATSKIVELEPGLQPRRKPLPQRPASKLSAAQLHPQLSDDPWLSETDLYGEPSESKPLSVCEPELLESQSRDQQAERTNLTLTSSPLAGYFIQNLVSKFQGLLLRPKQVSELVKRQKNTNHRLSSNLRPESSKSVNADESSNRPCTQSTQIDPAPDWIETSATVMGYVKHPLEQLLQWLDRAMLWLENFLMIVWRWVQKLLQSN